MQNDPVYQLTKNIPYPFVSRLDRSLYQEHPELDPASLIRKALFLSVPTYWAGKLTGYGGYRIAAVVNVGLLAWFLGQEWKVSQEEGGKWKYRPEVDFRLGNKFKIEKYEQEKEKGRKSPG